MSKFECHITTTTAHAAVATEIATNLHWKTSEIARDPVLGNHTFFYLTSHGATYDHIAGRMRECVDALLDAGVDVVREKIEDIVHDTKLCLVGPGPAAEELERLRKENARLRCLEESFIEAAAAAHSRDA